MNAEPSLQGRTALVLAASVQQVPLIMRCLALGARVITLDNRPDNPGHALAHRSVDADIRDIPAVLATIRETGAEGVIAAASDVALETAAEVAARTGLPGPPLTIQDGLLSKTGFRALQGRLGLPAPAWARAGDPPPGRGPWIVKPVRGSGSRGICTVEREADLAAALHEAAQHSRDGQAMLEAWLPGSQHTAEGWIQGGRIAALMVTDRLTARAPHVATLGHRVPAALPAPIQAALEAQFEAIFAEIGYPTGPFDADLVLTEQGPILIELSPRAGGNALMHLVTASTGFDQMGAIARHALGLDPGLSPWLVRPAAAQVLSDPEGGVLRYDASAVAALQAEPWIADLTLDLPPGAPVPAFTDGRARFGQVVFTGTDREDLERRLRLLRERLGMRVEPEGDAAHG